MLENIRILQIKYIYNLIKEKIYRLTVYDSLASYVISESSDKCAMQYERLKLSEILANPDEYDTDEELVFYFTDNPIEELESEWDVVEYLGPHNSPLELIARYYAAYALLDLDEYLFDVYKIRRKVNLGSRYTLGEKLLYDIIEEDLLSVTEPYNSYLMDADLLRKRLSSEQIEILSKELTNRFKKATGLSIGYDETSKKWYLGIRGFRGAKVYGLTQGLIAAAKYTSPEDTYNRYSYILVFYPRTEYVGYFKRTTESYNPEWNIIVSVPDTTKKVYIIEIDTNIHNFLEL